MQKLNRLLITAGMTRTRPLFTAPKEGSPKMLASEETIQSSGYRPKLLARPGVRKASLFTALLAGLLGLSAPQSARALPGDLDTSFDGDGKAVVNFGGLDFITAIAEQPDSKLVAVGGSGGDFALARFNPNGTLDTSFGTNGIRTTDLGSDDDHAQAVVIAGDGRIFAAGLTGFEFAVARYSPNGTLEASFEGTYGGAQASANAIRLAPDGGILIAGSHGATPADFASASDFGIAKLASNFIFDPSFSRDGTKTVDLGGADRASALAVLGDGTIVLAGLGGPDGDFAILRLSSNGDFIIASTRTDFGGVDIARALAVQDDGRVVAVGQTLLTIAPPPFTEVDKQMVVARYTMNPLALDTTFDTDGKRFIDFGPQSDARDVAVQPDGKIVVVGLVDVTNTNQEFAIARLQPTGGLDTTFSGDGLLRTAFTVSAGASALLLQRNNGRIVAAGTATTRNSSGTVTNRDVALARFHAITCNNLNVTRIGTNGPDFMFGAFIVTASGAVAHLVDVIHAFGGDDTVNAGGQNDTVCGGSGNDVLNGGAGNDTLRADGGTGDDLDGSDGTDTCIGSAFTDFQNCETVSTSKGGFSGEWLDVSQRCNRSSENPQCRLLGGLEVENPGTESTTVPAIAAVYLSFDDQLDEGDVFLTNVDIPVLEPGETEVLRLNVKVSDFEELSDLQAIAVLDAGDVVTEVNEENNIVVSDPVR